jgi:hypothetical protein
MLESRLEAAQQTCLPQSEGKRCIRATRILWPQEKQCADNLKIAVLTPKHYTMKEYIRSQFCASWTPDIDNLFSYLYKNLLEFEIYK